MLHIDNQYLFSVIKFNITNKIFILYILAGSVLIFVTKKANAEELATNLKLKEYEGNVKIIDVGLFAVHID